MVEFHEFLVPDLTLLLLNRYIYKLGMPVSTISPMDPVIE